MTVPELRHIVREFRREQVITTALKIFGQTGSLDASLEEIAARAGVSRSTIYNHFHDRGELLGACAEWASNRLFAAIAKAIALPRRPEAILAAFYEAAFTCLDENPGFYRLTTSLRSPLNVAEILIDARLAVGTHGVSHVDQLVRQLDAATNGRIDVDQARTMIGLLLVGALDRRSLQIDPPPAAQVAQELAEVLLHGLLRRRVVKSK